MQTIACRIMLLGLLFALAACATSSSSQASSGVQYGIQDDTWLEFGPGSLDQRLSTFKRLGMPLVRFTLRWNEIALRRPKDPTSPTDRAYDWHRPDMVLRGLRRYGLTPVYARRNAGVGKRRALAELRPAAILSLPPLRDGRRPSLPLGSLLADLERAEQASLAQATKPGIYVRHLLNPGYEAIHAVLPHARVGGGVTGPRGARGRRLTRRLGSRHGARTREVRRVRSPPVPGVAVGDAVQRRLQELPVDHDGDDPKLLILVKRDFGSKPIWADGVRLSDEPA